MRRAERIVEPRRHQHRALDHEEIPIFARAKAVEQPFQSTERQQQLERLTALAGDVLKVSMHRSTPIPDWLLI